MPRRRRDIYKALKFLLKEGTITQMACGQNLAFIMEDEAAFFATEYKVLQSRTESCFVRCMRMTWNGKLMLLYLTDQYKPFSSLLPSLGAESFMTIVSNLLGDISDVLDNGFLNSSNIDITPEHIFVEPATLKVKLIYVPSKERLYGDDAAFEGELRSSLIKLILQYPNFASQKTLQLKANLSNGKVRFKDLLTAAAEIPAGTVKEERTAENTYTSGPLKPARRAMKIAALNAPFKFELLVNKDRFVIGKKPESCDGVIAYNKMISRNHCAVEYNAAAGCYTVTDLGSANGTYLNGVRLERGRPASLKNADRLRLADSDFQIIII